MKDKGHFYISLAKSSLRISGGLSLLNSWDFRIFAFFFILAELLGILEEVVDRR